jgi:hypothetical protein
MQFSLGGLVLFNFTMKIFNSTITAEQKSLPCNAVKEQYNARKLSRKLKSHYGARNRLQEPGLQLSSQATCWRAGTNTLCLLGS